MVPAMPAMPETHQDTCTNVHFTGPASPQQDPGRFVELGAPRPPEMPAMPETH